MFAQVLCSRSEAEHLGFGHCLVEDMDVCNARRAFGERARLVECDLRCDTELFHYHGRLDQDAVPARVGDGGEQGWHRGEYDGARARHDHERHCSQQGRLQRVAEEQGHDEQRHRRTHQPDGVTLFDSLDEELRLRLCGACFFDQRDDPRDHRFCGGSRYSDAEPPSPLRLPAKTSSSPHLKTGRGSPVMDA